MPAEGLADLLDFQQGFRSSYLDPFFKLMVFALGIDHDPFAAKDDKGHQDQGIKNDPQGAEGPQQFGNGHQDKSPEDRTDQGPAAADDGRGDGDNGEIQGQGGRCRPTCRCGPDRPRPGRPIPEEIKTAIVL